jgi:hypothetical protein
VNLFDLYGHFPQVLAIVLVYGLLVGLILTAIDQSQGEITSPYDALKTLLVDTLKGITFVLGVLVGLASIPAGIVYGLVMLFLWELADPDIDAFLDDGKAG